MAKKRFGREIGDLGLRSWGSGRSVKAALDNREVTSSRLYVTSRFFNSTMRSLLDVENRSASLRDQFTNRESERASLRLRDVHKV